jgi:transcriptional regulator with XRE-family HTH domain
MPMSNQGSPNKPIKKAARKGRNPSLSQLLKWAMEKKKLSGKRLSKLAGLDQAIVSRLVSGARSNPMPETIEGLAKALDLPLSELWDARRVSRAIAATVGKKSSDGTNQ